MKLFDATWFGTLVGATVGVLLSLSFTTIYIPAEVARAGEHLCVPNEGLRTMRIRHNQEFSRYYDFECRNTALFLNVRIDISRKSDSPIEPAAESK